MLIDLSLPPYSATPGAEVSAALQAAVDALVPLEGVRSVLAWPNLVNA